MAEIKKVVMSAETQRDCLTFASDMYYYTINHPAIRKFLPPRLPGASESLFNENIGKAVMMYWHANKEELENYHVYDLKILRSPDMKKEIDEFFMKTSKNYKNVFNGVLFMSTFLMDLHLFLFQRGYEGTLTRLPALWTGVFQNHFSRRFFAKGGWNQFKSYCVDGARKFDFRFKGYDLETMLNLYVLTNMEYKSTDQTKELRLFVVQKSLECLQCAREQFLNRAKCFLAATAEMKLLSEMVGHIAKTCEDSDKGKEDLGESNVKIKSYVEDFCMTFYGGDEFQRFLNRMQCPSSKSKDEGCESKEESQEGSQEVEHPAEHPAFTEEQLELLNQRWEEEISNLRQLLRTVTPPGTDEDSIDRMVDYDYTREVIQKIGGMRVSEPGPDDMIEEELNKIGIYVPGKPQKQFDEKTMLAERIRVLEGESSSQIKSPQKTTSQPPKIDFTPKTSIGGALPKIRPTNPSTQEPSRDLDLEEPQSSTSGELKQSEDVKTSPRKPRSRTRKGSKK